MADSHLQVNPDGTITERKTVLWPSDSTQKQEIIKNIFTRDGWTVTDISHQSGNFWKIKSISNLKSWNINLYISSIRDESRQSDEFKMQLGTTYPGIDEPDWISIILGIYVVDDGISPCQYILSGYDKSGYDFSTNPSLRGTRTKGLQQAFLNGIYKAERTILFRPELIYFYIENLSDLFRQSSKQEFFKSDLSIAKENSVFLTALKTKPFLLLAGISGTGKSQKVQELAFMTCPDGDLRNEGGTTPGNYCLIEVKPNWHDSTELLGYYSALSGKYELTDFIRFVYKAIQNEDIPFFLCLDEMNLAPVEQYFAEFLSVLETRKKVGDRILSQPLLTKEKFAGCELQEYILTDGKGVVVTADNKNYNMKELYSESDAKIIEYLKKNGLSLPDNLFVIGTVNMDDTTHQFSRKVIDRTFTIEMNGGEMADMFKDESKFLLEYRDEPIPLGAFKSQFVRAYEVLDDERFVKYKDTISTRIPKILGNSDGTAVDDSINSILNNTPFRVSYRVQNELVLYLSTLIENAGFPDDIDGLISEATLAILLEKILPRIQGEHKQLETRNGSNVLRDLKEYVENHFKPKDDAKDKSLYNRVIKKLEEMDKKLDNYYTNFF